MAALLNHLFSAQVLWCSATLPSHAALQMSERAAMQGIPVAVLQGRLRASNMMLRSASPCFVCGTHFWPSCCMAGRADSAVHAVCAA